jgi:thiol-disulfide isomerase/thioredoxin
MALADLYEKKGDETALEALLSEALKATPPPAGAVVKLAKLEARRGNATKALELFIAAAAQGSISAADDAAMRTLYRSQHNGSDAGLDSHIDDVYREKFPNPVKPEPYTPSPSRTSRLVLLEMFTGSGCGPCAAADLAFDAVMERYPAGTIVPVAYHQHIPAPDPMVTTGSVARKEYYQIRGVPTFNIDGALGRLGGGSRTNTATAYKDYVAKIDKALETPALAELLVSATGDGDRIVAIANVSKLPGDARDLRLHILLVERDLRFSGENGIRFHPVTVRASAGENGNGIPIAATGKTQHTFSLSAIKEDITRTLQAEMDRRRKTELPGATPREYAADGRPYVAIDPAHLSVVAFIQQGAYRAPGGPTTPVAGIEPSVDALPTAGATILSGGAQPAPARLATTGPLANVLQAAIAEVVFPTARR